MTKAIKVVYNWIGPRGPLWNTELPTVYSIASACDNISVNSRNFWVDDSWTKFFNLARPKYELSPATLIDDTDTFIYPFSLAWRTPFDQYFLAGSGLLEFSHCPNHIVHHVRSSKGYFMIDMGAEAFSQDQHLKSMHSYFRHNLQIPMNKIIYLTGTANAMEIYEQFCNKFQIPDRPEERMVMLPYLASQQGFSQRLTDPNNPHAVDPDYDVNKIPDKLFLMWNRRYREHRTSLAVALDREGIVDRSYVSMTEVDTEHPINTFESSMSPHSFPNLGINYTDVLNFSQKLPLVLDGETEISNMCGDFENKTRNYYQNSLISLVTETNFRDAEVTITEKSLKPLKEKQPFIIVGVNGTLRVMREMGIKTFSDFWDERYDEIGDHNSRMGCILELCKEISHWSNDKILEFRRNVVPILEHNRQWIKQNPGEIISNMIYDMITERHKE